MKALLIITSVLFLCRVDRSAGIPWKAASAVKLVQKRSSNTALSLPRGGESALTAIGNILSSDNLCGAVVGSALVGGGLCAAAPEYALVPFGGEAMDEDSLSCLFTEIAGYVTVGLGITMYLSGTKSLGQAVGYGLFTRPLFLAKGLLSGQFDKFPEFKGKTKLAVAKLIGGSGVVLALMSGKFYPEALVKAVSVLQVLVGTAVFLCPVSFSKRVSDLDLGGEGNEQAREMFRQVGGSIVCSGLYGGVLSFVPDCEPSTALGYTCAAGALMSLDTRGAKDVGMTRRQYLSWGIAFGAVALRILLSSASSAADESE